MRALLSTSLQLADQMTEPWASVDDVAAHLGVRKDSIYRWIESRGLPARKIGKLWKMKLSEVDEWVRTRGVAENSAATSTRSQQPRAVQWKAAAPVILVIDDEEVVRETIGEFLEDQGYEALLACDGSEALTLLVTASRMPSLIILDLQMPNLDGRRFLEHQALDPKLAVIPVIVVTADRSANANVAAVIRKPLRIDHLAKAIDGVLEPA